jgi:hypothetical protein
MTIRQTINLLRSQGHKVTYYERRDGGVLIKSIDGQRFSGATGNLYARAMSGQTLSVNRAKQLGNITWSGKRLQSQIPSSEKEIKKKLVKVQRIWRKSFPKVDGKVPPVGRKTAKKVKWSLEHRGKEETLRLLEEAEKYAKGKAYSKNIQQLADFINDTGIAYHSKDLQDLAKDILANAWMIEESAINPTYQELYKLNDGVPPEEVARNVRSILNL